MKTSYSTLDSESICIDVSMYKNAPEYQWAFGDCIASHPWAGAAIYTERCCTSMGEQFLTCSTSRELNDWSLNALTILGHRFCDDQTGYAATISINISGNTIFLAYIHRYILK